MRSSQQGRRARPRPTATTPRTTPAAVWFDRLLMLPVVDRALGRLLAHPRMLQIGGLLIGVAMAALAIAALLAPARDLVDGSVASQEAFQRDTVQAAPTEAPEAQALAVVAAYNQASITAAVQGRPDPMAPYLASDGPAWAAVQTEYERRAARGEAHDPTLTRWGVLRITATGDAATVETQEQWDDITTVGGEVISSARGVLTRNVYELRFAPGAQRWEITSVTSTTLIGS